MTKEKIAKRLDFNCYDKFALGHKCKGRMFRNGNLEGTIEIEKEVGIPTIFEKKLHWYQHVCI